MSHSDTHISQVLARFAHRHICYLKYEANNIFWTWRTMLVPFFFSRYYHGTFICKVSSSDDCYAKPCKCILSEALARLHAYIKWIISKRWFIIHLKLCYHRVIKMFYISNNTMIWWPLSWTKSMNILRLDVVKCPFCRKYCIQMFRLKCSKKG